MKIPIPQDWVRSWLTRQGCLLKHLEASHELREALKRDYWEFLQKGVERLRQQEQAEAELRKAIEAASNQWQFGADNTPEDRTKEQQDAVRYWIKRGLCEESAMRMAGIKGSSWNGCNGGPRNVKLGEEWAWFDW